MKQTLIINGHPNIERSNANATILEAFKGLSNVEIRNLQTLYPNYKIDVAEEQKAMLKADTIILQFPMQWYALPAILKLWIDEVFTFGFAYGEGGDKLKGKKIVFSFTTGSNEESYSTKGYNRQGITEYTKPLEQLAIFSQLTYDIYYTFDCLYIPGVIPAEKLTDIKARVTQHAQYLKSKIG